MMMGVGFIFMLIFFIVLIGIPLLIVALVAGESRGSLFRSRPNPSPPVSSHPTPVEPTYVHKCPTCGRGVKTDWNVCPSCGANLN
jgi:hypothetical protein